MALEDAVLALGGAEGLFLKTGAAIPCPKHPEIFIRIGGADKEKRAYELADALPDGERQAAKESMAASLRTMLDQRCPVCAAEDKQRTKGEE